MIDTAASSQVNGASDVQSDKAARSAALSFQEGSLSSAAITPDEILISKL